MPVESFNRNTAKKDGRACTCRECQKIYKNQHYARNKDRVIEDVAQRKREIREWFKEYRSNLSCIQCGFSHPAAIEFHHRDPSKKDRAVGVLVNMALSKEAILREIAKCDPLCCNCHRILHYDTGYDNTKLGGDEE
ncbi:MAG: hypothetical protein EOP83_04460 [Verrucomicrobiaceae bacterium]|nr:MAG: hypothetical protein EOP83_04460 [Verrucomicrobiaceae bacterium]